MAKLLNGAVIAANVRDSVSEGVTRLVESCGEMARPCLAIILVGEDSASRLYVGKKIADCNSVGIAARSVELPCNISEAELISIIAGLNTDNAVTGILCQLPLPNNISEKNVIRTIAREKDVDGFLSLISSDIGDMPACTPAGVMELIRSEGIDVTGMHCVILGRSNIVGKPMAMQMLLANATVTVCHTKTRNIGDITRNADIIVAAVGSPKFVSADMVKEGAIVIDVGINRGADGKLCGDVDFDAVSKKASYITPVPGGVGPMTRAMLLKNTLKAATSQTARLSR